MVASFVVAICGVCLSNQLRSTSPVALDSHNRGFRDDGLFGQPEGVGEVGGDDRIVPVSSPKPIRAPSAPGAEARIVTVSPSSRKARVEPSERATGSVVPGEFEEATPLVTLGAGNGARGVEVAGPESGAVGREVGELLRCRPVHPPEARAGA